MSHDHDHLHEPVTTADDSPIAMRVRALEEILVERAVLTREDIRARIDWMVSRSPADGARLVARAWVDEGFRKRLLGDARAAALELGVHEYHFVRRYLERQPSLPLTLQQVDPLIRELQQYREVIQLRLKESEPT